MKYPRHLDDLEIVLRFLTAAQREELTLDGCHASEVYSAAARLLRPLIRAGIAELRAIRAAAEGCE